MEKFFASCPRGLEALLAEDLVAAGVKDLKQIPGGVHFAADWPACYAANLRSRIATRILWRVAHGRYAKEDDIYKLALDTAWPTWFTAAQTIRVDVTAVKSPLKSLEFITLRIKDAVCDRFRADVDKRPNVDTREPDVRVHGFITADECTLYIDTSGAPLYQRGLRQKTVEAPLKENVAAGILRLSGWQPGTPLIDQMCGSEVQGSYLPDGQTEALQEVLDALKQEPGHRLSVAEWAERVHLTERTLARHCQNELGMSLGEWRQRLRYLRAVDSLEHGQSVQSIALDLGFSTPSAFIAMFQREAGVSPDQFRKEFLVSTE